MRYQFDGDIADPEPDRYTLMTAAARVVAFTQILGQDDDHFPHAHRALIGIALA
jgi:hypothetical protein